MKTFNSFIMQPNFGSVTEQVVDTIFKSQGVKFACFSGGLVPFQMFPANAQLSQLNAVPDNQFIEPSVRTVLNKTLFLDLSS